MNDIDVTVVVTPPTPITVTLSSYPSGVVSSTSPVLYDAVHRVISIQKADADQPGYLSADDFATFDAKGDMQSSVYDTGNKAEDVFNFATAMAVALG